MGLPLVFADELRAQWVRTAVVYAPGCPLTHLLGLLVHEGLGWEHFGPHSPHALPVWAEAVFHLAVFLECPLDLPLELLARKRSAHPKGMRAIAWESISVCPPASFQCERSSAVAPPSAWPAQITMREGSC